jgi:hypothetical protein
MLPSSRLATSQNRLQQTVFYPTVWSVSQLEHCHGQNDTDEKQHEHQHYDVTLAVNRSLKFFGDISIDGLPREGRGADKRSGHIYPAMPVVYNGRGSEHKTWQ